MKVAWEVEIGNMDKAIIPVPGTHEPWNIGFRKTGLNGLS